MFHRARTVLGLALLVLLAGCSRPASLPSATAQDESRAVKAQDINLVRSAIANVVKREFQSLDTDKNGVLTRAELAKKSPLFLVMWQTIDVNMDDVVTYDEFMNRMAGNMDAVSRLLYTLMDVNNDGLLSAADVSKWGYKAIISLMDTNDNGSVDFNEFQRFVTSPGMINPGKWW
ncbi:EF-hand domain-containing protein [bacterium]|nr:EF-hand domain-containing protein [bacterium]